jgi:hypothetical protein
LDGSSSKHLTDAELMAARQTADDRYCADSALTELLPLDPPPAAISPVLVHPRLANR